MNTAPSNSDGKAGITFNASYVYQPDNCGVINCGVMFDAVFPSLLLSATGSEKRNLKLSVQSNSDHTSAERIYLS
jgi:hypothetical protein